MEMEVTNRHHTNLVHPSRRPRALARRDRQTDALTLDHPSESALSGRGTGPLFVAYGTLDLPGIGRVFYLIFSDAPLTRDPAWILILVCMKSAGRLDIAATARWGLVGGLQRRAAPRSLDAASESTSCPAIDVTC